MTEKDKLEKIFKSFCDIRAEFVNIAATNAIKEEEHKRRLNNPIIMEMDKTITLLKERTELEGLFDN